jgi:sugar lactone lactonase YvrE
MTDITAEPVPGTKADLGEGPLWDAANRQLYYVDIIAGDIHIFDPAKGTDRTINVGQPVGVVALRKNGGLVAGLHHGFAFVDQKTGRAELIHHPEQGVETNRFNDGKVDPAGRFWAGTMPFDGKDAVGALYRMDADRTVRKMIPNVTISNGLDWSADGRTFYFIDSRQHNIVAYDMNPESGDITNGREVHHFPRENTLPDGMSIDVEGMLWVAHYRGGDVTRIDPKAGKQIGRIVVPGALDITSCAFGGDNLDILYITTSRLGHTPEQRVEEPNSGSLFAARPGVKGRPSVAFAG